MEAQQLTGSEAFNVVLNESDFKPWTLFQLTAKVDDRFGTSHAYQ